MAIPRLNHTQIPNLFLEKHVCRLSGAGVKVFLSICRKTIGWQKDTDRISLSQLREMTGLSGNGIRKAILELIDADLIAYIKGGSPIGQKSSISEFQINYASQTGSESEPVPVHKVNQLAVQTGSESEPTKETKNIKKNEHDHAAVAAEAEASPVWEAYLAHWNDTAAKCGLASIRGLTAGRKKKVAARIKSDGEFISTFKSALFKIEQLHDFGRRFIFGAGSMGWKIDFDWLIYNDENISKLLEGKYDGETKKTEAERKAEAIARLEKLRREQNG